MNKPDYLISTPENVDLHLELAGLGNRIYACFLDTFISFCLILLIVAVCLGFALAIDRMSIASDTKTIIYYYIVGIGVFLCFVVNFGYFIFFEGTWQGQTPGKKASGIRVIEANGQPVTWASVLIRNLLRVVDQNFGLIGILPMIIDRTERRFGDLAAGTLVIRERLPALSSQDLKIAATLPAESFVDIGQISPDEYQLLLTFLKRRCLMSVGQRPRLAKNLAEYFRGKLNCQAEGESPESFLEKLYLAYVARAQLAAD